MIFYEKKLRKALRCYIPCSIGQDMNKTYNRILDLVVNDGRTDEVSLGWVADRMAAGYAKRTGPGVVGHRKRDQGTQPERKEAANKVMARVSDRMSSTHAQQVQSDVRRQLGNKADRGDAAERKLGIDHTGAPRKDNRGRPVAPDPTAKPKPISRSAAAARTLSAQRTNSTNRS